ncbi:hypothetical protein HWV62_32549 [Athelia sp. TMB]|nr:hypothetical protein HWV62_32549 [Athelia sp. TMB]
MASLVTHQCLSIHLLSSTDTAQIYSVTGPLFQHQISFVDISDHALCHAIIERNAFPVLGLDTEWVKNQVELITISWAAETILIRGVNDPIKALLADTRVLKVGVAIEDAAMDGVAAVYVHAELESLANVAAAKRANPDSVPYPPVPIFHSLENSSTRCHKWLHQVKIDLPQPEAQLKPTKVAERAFQLERQLQGMQRAHGHLVVQHQAAVARCRELEGKLAALQ